MPTTNAHLQACAVFTAGAAAMASAPGLVVLLIGRLLVGLGIGFASMTVPVCMYSGTLASATDSISMSFQEQRYSE